MQHGAPEGTISYRLDSTNAEALRRAEGAPAGLSSVPSARTAAAVSTNGPGTLRQEVCSSALLRPASVEGLS